MQNKAVQEILCSGKFSEGLIFGNFLNLVHFLKIYFWKLLLTMYKHLLRINAKSKYNFWMKDCLPWGTWPTTEFSFFTATAYKLHEFPSLQHLPYASWTPKFLSMWWPWLQYLHKIELLHVYGDENINTIIFWWLSSFLCHVYGAFYYKLLIFQRISVRLIFAMVYSVK